MLCYLNIIRKKYISVEEIRSLEASIYTTSGGAYRLISRLIPNTTYSTLYIDMTYYKITSNNEISYNL